MAPEKGQRYCQKSSSVLPSQSSSLPLQVSAGGVQLLQEHVSEQVLLPVEPHEVVHAPDEPAQQIKPLSQLPSQSSSLPLQVSAGGVQVPQEHDDEHTLLPVEPHEVVHEPVSFLQQSKPLSQLPSQSSSTPLQVSGGGMQALHMHVDVQLRRPAEPQEVVQKSVRPLQQSKPLSQLPSQSSSLPLQISAGGVQFSGDGTVQSMPQVPVPVEPQEVVQDTLMPMRQSNPSSMVPSQLSSTPLQDSESDEGTQLDSHEPSPSRSAHPSWHRTVQRPLSHRGSAFSPAVQTLPQEPQLLTSLVISTQLPPQAIFPAGHSMEQTPVAHTS